MSFRMSPYTRRITLLAGLWLAPLALPADAQPTVPEPVISGRTPVEISRAPGELRAQSVDVAVEALTDPAAPGAADPRTENLVRVDLFGDEILLLEASERRAIARGGFAWIGKSVDGPLGQAVFVIRNTKLYGSIRRPGLNVQIRPEPGGGHRMVEHDESLWSEEVDDGIDVWNGTATYDTPPTVLVSAPPPDPLAPIVGNPVIDVLVVYTADARVGAGGTEAMEALIDLGELETNTSYANSGVNQRIRIVHTEEVVYAETGDSGTDLSRLRATNDGFMDNVHTLRDTYGADVVSLWLESTGCGRGYIMTTISSTFQSSAFNVCKRTCATGNLTFGHELGHNMSLRHDWYLDDSVNSPSAFNHGFVDIDVDVGSSFRTVMAYGDRCADTFGGFVCTRLQYFSNPNVTIGGDDAGVPPGTSTACIEDVVPATECDADNRLALNNSAATVAGFRPTQVLAQIVKSVDEDFVDIGDTITYTLTVINNGTLTAEDVVLEDTVPSHTSLIAGSLSGDAVFSGTTAGSTITWTTSTDLAAGHTLVRSFSVTAVGGGIATNTAQVTSDSGAITSVRSSNSVATGVWEPVACGFVDDFETGTLSHFWRTDTTQDGRIRVTSELPDAGTYSAVLDDAVSDTTVSQATLVLSANLAGKSTAQLDFRWAEAGDENGTLDGVFVREGEADPWVKVLDFAAVPDLVFQSASIDLVQAAAVKALTLTDGFQIGFRFSDNFQFNPGSLGSSDGYAIDNVSLSCSCSTELTETTITGPDPVVEQSACTIYAAPNYTVTGTGNLTLHSEQGVVLRNGFTVMADGELTVLLAPIP